MRLGLGVSSESDQCTTEKGLTSYAVLYDWPSSSCTDYLRP